jgi:hypothetical protein
MKHNLDYRAQSDNPDEQEAVDESFARSVIWGFEILGERDDTILIDATEFLIRDAHRITDRLSGLEEGEFTPDPSRSAIYMPNTKAFPDNSEIEAIVTFTGKATGPYLTTVIPDADSFSVHLHHSLIRLPDDGYEPLLYEPRSGYIGLRYDGTGFQDYASDIGEPLTVEYGRRHRLEKRDPSAEVSEAVEPIVYYVDRGAPEPIRTALIEGASWWNEAFEAAGYKDAYRVELGRALQRHPMGASLDAWLVLRHGCHRSTDRGNFERPSHAGFAARQAGLPDCRRFACALRRRGAAGSHARDVAGENPPAVGARSWSYPRHRAQHGRQHAGSRIRDGLPVSPGSLR